MKLKRHLTSLMIILGLMAPIGWSVAPVAAVNVVPGCGAGSAGGTPKVCGDLSSGSGGSDPVVKIIKATIDILSYVVGVASILGIVVGGIRMVVANGDAGSIARARTGIIFSLVGIVIVIVAQSIVVFVIDKLNRNGL